MSTVFFPFLFLALSLFFSLRRGPVSFGNLIMHIRETHDMMTYGRGGALPHTHTQMTRAAKDPLAEVAERQNRYIYLSNVFL